MTYGTFLQIDGRPAVRFERRLTHPIERVWEAVTDPAELAGWFPARVERDGDQLHFAFEGEREASMHGKVIEEDPPRLFVFRWEDDELRFELRPDGDGCVLVLTNVLDGTYPAASVAAGWHVCLGELQKLLAGEPATAPGTEPTPEHERLQAEYAERGAPAPAGDR